MNPNQLCITFMKKIKFTFLKESYGKLSFTRIIGTILVLFYVSIAIYLAITEKRFVDIPTNLMILILALYGINRISQCVKNISN